MKKVMVLLYLAVFSAAFIFTTPALSLSDRPVRIQSGSPRADMIVIDGLTVFGKRDKPPVVFLHDAHTRALAEKNQSKERLVCSACHPTEDGKLFPKFMRTTDINKKVVMNLYHDECISCHGRMRNADEKTGPVECGDCHTRQPSYVPLRSPVGFDNSLHYRHSEAEENKCETCHHAYDEKKKTLYYAKGEEGTCRYCHEQQTVENRVSMPIASHMACLGCHINIDTSQGRRPPVTCTACHDPAEQANLKTIPEVPRIKRNQPDIVLLRADDKTKAGDFKSDRTGRMNLVPFNHLVHEKANSNCRVCHHNSLDACNTCHTPEGPARETLDAQPGNTAVSLDKAMHSAWSDRSCIGCHNNAKKKPSCAGCHGFISPVKTMTETQCITCHSVKPNTLDLKLDRTRAAAIARTALDSKKRIHSTYPESDIPEMVTINRLENLYEPVPFPHRKVVNAIVSQVADHPVSGFFHANEATICQGCHHNSPASKTPPPCASCHGARWDVNQLSKPGILGAYHQQCMGCHKAMAVEKPMGCTECHKLKAK